MPLISYISIPRVGPNGTPEYVRVSLDDMFKEPKPALVDQIKSLTMKDTASGCVIF